MLQIADFGAKIGGARKDLWAERGLAVSDLAGMNGREADKYVTKANVWPVPDYEAMVADGMPLCVAWYRKRVRDALIASPRCFGSDTPEKRLARQQQYVETVCELRARVEQVETAEDAAGVLNDFFLGGGYVRAVDNGICRRPHYFTTPKGQDTQIITNKLFRAVDASADAERFEADMTAEAVRKGFLQKKAEKPAAKRAPRKKRYVPVQLQCVLREGPDYRGGREIKGADYIAMFGFRGGEFGNWMNQNDRQESLNMGYDALLDLAEALGISNTDISLNETLAIAFGARGRGNAAAHYEPLRQVINLTKLRGAGSLAHEWWHALDDMLGTLHGCAGVFATERPGAWPLAEKLVETMRYVHDADGRTMGRTEYYINSREMDRHYSKSGGYWASNIEMAARAFACYVADKLNGRSDYLVGHAETAETPGGKPAYPMGAEREAINAVFDEIFAGLIADGVFRARRDVDRPKPHKTATFRTEPVWDVPSGAQTQLSFFSASV